MQLSVFDSVKDSKPKQVDLSWTDLFHTIRNPEVRSIKDGRLFSPAIYKNDRRAKENVQSISFLCLDIDDGMTFDEGQEIVIKAGIKVFLHSTWSHQRITDSNPTGQDRFRAIIPLSRDVTPDEYPGVWQWGKELFHGRVDEAAKDASRIYYFPSVFSDDSPYRHFIRSSGIEVDPDNLPVLFQVDDVPLHIVADTAYAQAALNKEVENVLNAEQGERNHVLNTAAFNLGTLIAAGALDEVEVRDRLEAAALLSGLTPQETRGTINSGIRGGKKFPRTVPEPETQESQDESDIPVLTKPRIEFPVTAFPAWVREFIVDVAETTQTPMEVAGVFCLSALAALSAPQVRLRIRPDWHENLNLYLLAALPPGHRKSAVHRFVLDPIYELEKEIRDKERDEIAREMAMRDALIAQATGLKRKLSNLDGSAFDAVSEQVADLGVRIANWPERHEKRLCCDDVTPETLATLLADQGGAMALLSAEGGIFSIVGGRYSEGRVNFDVFLKGHAGDDLRIDRRGRNEVIENPRLTLCLAVQPDVLREAASRTEFRERGLLARFLYVVPESNVGFRKINPQPARPLVLRAWRDGIQDLYRTRKVEVLRLSPAAHASLVKYESEVEVDLRPEGQLDPIIDWGAKLVGATARIAGLLHLAENVQEGTLATWSDEVQDSTVQNAIKLAECFKAHALSVFASMKLDRLDHESMNLLKRLVRRDLKVFTIRQLSRVLPPGTPRSARHLKPILENLVTEEWITFQSTKRAGIYTMPDSTFNQIQMSMNCRADVGQQKASQAVSDQDVTDTESANVEECRANVEQQKTPQVVPDQDVTDEKSANVEELGLSQETEGAGLESPNNQPASSQKGQKLDIQRETGSQVLDSTEDNTSKDRSTFARHSSTFTPEMPPQVVGGAGDNAFTDRSTFDRHSSTLIDTTRLKEVMETSDKMLEDLERHYPGFGGREDWMENDENDLASLSMQPSKKTEFDRAAKAYLEKVKNLVRIRLKAAKKAK